MAERRDGPKGPFSLLIREPLVLFLLLGAGVFLYDALSPKGAPGADREITVTEGDLTRLQASWTGQFSRPPTSEEWQMIVEEHIREEILYREALRLGLERNDVIIRRRLAQKISFLSEDLATLEEPTEEEIKEHYKAQSALWMQPPRQSFQHIYFSPERSDAETRARKTLEDIKSADLDTGRLGDPFMLARNYAERTDREIGELFGRDFAQALSDLPEDKWMGPLPSALGLHLVRITDRREALLPPFEAVRERVRDHLLASRREEANIALYEDLKSQYQITIEDFRAEDDGPVKPAEEMM